MAKNNNLTDFVVDIADAIREKEGSTDKINPQDFHDRILAIKGAEETPIVEEKDVNFYDYDGTLLFSYTIEEAQALTELPTPKGHEGLVFEGWNWDYEDVIALDYPMDIGAMYVTDDGATRIYIKIDNERAKEIDLQLYTSAKTRISIDWGDGTTETLSKEYATNVPHTYENLGEYVIRLQAVAGTYALNAGIKVLIVGSLYGHPERQDIVQKVEFGSNLRPSQNYLFQYCNQVKSVSIPSGLTQIGTNAFAKTTMLKMVVLPKGTLTIGASVFQFGSIENISIPKSVTSIANMTFRNANVKRICLPPNVADIGNESIQQTRTQSIFLSKSLKQIPLNACQGNTMMRTIVINEGVSNIGMYGIGSNETLQKVVFPQSITSLDNYACYGLVNAVYLDFSKCTAIPTLAAANSIGNLHADTKIIVPDALYDQWIVATNWTTHKDRIVKDSEYVRPL